MEIPRWRSRCVLQRVEEKSGKKHVACSVVTSRRKQACVRAAIHWYRILCGGPVAVLLELQRGHRHRSKARFGIGYVVVEKPCWCEDQEFSAKELERGPDFAWVGICHHNAVAPSSELPLCFSTHTEEI